MIGDSIGGGMMDKELRLLLLQKLHKSSSVPYIDIGGIRKFSSLTNTDEFVWHRDEEDREIVVLSGNNWMLQFDNQLPKELEIGKKYIIKKNSWHRVIKGYGDLIIKIIKF